MNYLNYVEALISDGRVEFWNEESEAKYIECKEWSLTESEELVNFKVALCSQFNDILEFSFQARIDDYYASSMAEVRRDIINGMEFTEINGSRIKHLISSKCHWWLMQSQVALPSENSDVNAFLVCDDLDFLNIAWINEGLMYSFNWGRWA